MSPFGHSTQVSSQDQLKATCDYKKENFFTVVACSFFVQQLRHNLFERNQEEYSNWFLTERSQTTVRDWWCDSIAISNISSYKVDGNTHELEYSLLCESTHFLVQLLFPSDCSESP